MDDEAARIWHVKKRTRILIASRRV